MSIKEIKFRSLESVIKYLESLAHGNQDYIFRGHSNTNYKLQTTLSRSSDNIFYENLSDNTDRLMEKFKLGLRRHGINHFESKNRLDWLELARHHGVPTPVLDFTYSPYVALFFAFNGVKDRNYSNLKNEYSVIYAVNLYQLANMWALNCNGSKKENYINSNKTHHSFLNPNYDKLFEEKYPVNILQFIPFPGQHNRRMQKQMGAILYDTINYKKTAYKDLDDFIDKFDEPVIIDSGGKTEKTAPTIEKIFINQKYTYDIFKKLEFMGISGGSLFMSEEGVAMDIINTIGCHAKVSFLRNNRSPTKNEKIF